MASVSEFRCPNCLGVFDKDEALEAMTSGEPTVGESYHMVIGGHFKPFLKCKSCGGDIDTMKLFSGDYDVGDYLYVYFGVFLIVLVGSMAYFHLEFWRGLVVAVGFLVLTKFALDPLDRWRYKKRNQS